MLSFVHTLISLPLAFYFENPLLVFVAAIVGHFLADSLLHWNLYPDQFKRYPFELVAVDIGLGLGVAWWLTGEAFLSLPVLLAIAGGNLPDAIHAIWELWGQKQKRGLWRQAAPFFHWHDNIQLETYSVAKGLISQVTLVTVAILLVWYSS